MATAMNECTKTSRSFEGRKYLQWDSYKGPLTLAHLPPVSILLPYLTSHILPQKQATCSSVIRSHCVCISSMPTRSKETRARFHHSTIEMSPRLLHHPRHLNRYGWKYPAPRFTVIQAANAILKLAEERSAPPVGIRDPSCIPTVTRIYPKIWEVWEDALLVGGNVLGLAELQHDTKTHDAHIPLKLG